MNIVNDRGILLSQLSILTFSIFVRRMTLWLQMVSSTTMKVTIFDKTKRLNLNKIIQTTDGSHTIYVPELDEHYHSVHGAVQESQFIFINNGFEYCKADPVSILEIGFGTGLNVLLTAMRNLSDTREVNFTSIEKYPLDKNTVNSLNHHEFAGEQGKEIFRLIHSSPWEQKNTIISNFNLTKLRSDLTVTKPEGLYDLIYFDAFGPDKQPEMWTSDIFESISCVTKKDGILVTYSAKGAVKRSLKACGFEVSLLPGPPGKRQMIRAVKI
jgi:tRNA U34 5-methylaminomethyl-2-thiouridine-forming methyltransferase MnmC